MWPLDFAKNVSALPAIVPESPLSLLDCNVIYEIMSEEKPNQQEHLRFRREDFNGYFPKSYTEQQIKKDILKGLELLHRHRQRNRDAR